MALEAHTLPQSSPCLYARQQMIAFEASRKLLGILCGSGRFQRFLRWHFFACFILLAISSSLGLSMGSTCLGALGPVSEFPVWCGYCKCTHRLVDLAAGQE